MPFGGWGVGTKGKPPEDTLLGSFCGWFLGRTKGKHHHGCSKDKLYPSPLQRKKGGGRNEGERPGAVFCPLFFPGRMKFAGGYPAKFLTMDSVSFLAFRRRALGQAFAREVLFPLLSSKERIHRCRFWVPPPEGGKPKGLEGGA